MDSLIEENGQSKTTKTNIVLKYTLKVMAFLLFLAVSPLVFLYIIWLVFNMVVLNDSVDIKPMLYFIANKIKEKEREEDYLDENITEDDLIMVDVEDITHKK